MIAEATIQAMAQRIVEKFDPLRIVLFGSCARGEAYAGDVDFLVIMPDGTPVREASVAMMRELRDAQAAKDVIVATPETLRRFGDSPGMIYRYALREGSVLYERS